MVFPLQVTRWSDVMDDRLATLLALRDAPWSRDVLQSLEWA